VDWPAAWLGVDLGAQQEHALYNKPQGGGKAAQTAAAAADEAGAACVVPDRCLVEGSWLPRIAHMLAEQPADMRVQRSAARVLLRTAAAECAAAGSSAEQAGGAITDALVAAVQASLAQQPAAVGGVSAAAARLSADQLGQLLAAWLLLPGQAAQGMQAPAAQALLRAAAALATGSGRGGTAARQLLSGWCQQYHCEVQQWRGWALCDGTLVRLYGEAVWRAGEAGGLQGLETLDVALAGGWGLRHVVAPDVPAASIACVARSCTPAALEGT
jgi:hypothetical protein